MNFFFKLKNSILQDAGYGGKSLFAVEEEEEGEETNQKIDDEVHVHLFVLLLLYVSFV